MIGHREVDLGYLSGIIYSELFTLRASNLKLRDHLSSSLCLKRMCVFRALFIRSIKAFKALGTGVDDRAPAMGSQMSTLATLGLEFKPRRGLFPFLQLRFKVKVPRLYLRGEGSLDGCESPVRIEPHTHRLLGWTADFPSPADTVNLT